jgi:hypothetical protein
MKNAVHWDAIVLKAAGPAEFSGMIMSWLLSNRIIAQPPHRW